jgi:hypothetical protein
LLAGRGVQTSRCEQYQQTAVVTSNFVTVAVQQCMYESVAADNVVSVPRNVCIVADSL